eukprot:5822838-Amphidinium_carterae.2
MPVRVVGSAELEPIRLTLNASWIMLDAGLFQWEVSTAVFATSYHLLFSQSLIQQGAKTTIRCLRGDRDRECVTLTLEAVKWGMAGKRARDGA